MLTLYAPRRPRFAQLAFLVVALFILTNKVYSPQYVLWLMPLAALARPRWRDFLIWQACEVMYFLGIWLYLAYTGNDDKHQGLPLEGYQLAIVLHLLGTLYLCAVVVRDILMPERDVVRRDGDDDPSGGVLDRAPDVFVLGRGHHDLGTRCTSRPSRRSLGRGPGPRAHDPRPGAAELLVHRALSSCGTGTFAQRSTMPVELRGGVPQMGDQLLAHLRLRASAGTNRIDTCMCGGSANQRCLPAHT